MSDDVGESGSVEPKAAGDAMPTPKSLETSSDKPSSQGQDVEAIVGALMDQLTPVIEEKVKRATQAQKDRRFDRLEKGQSEILEKFLGYMESGMDANQAAYQMKLDSTVDFVDNLKGTRSTSTAQGMGAVDVAKAQRELLQEANIPPNDENIAEFINSYSGSDPVKYLDDLKSHIIRRLANKPKASPAGAVMPGGGQTMPSGISGLEDSELVAKLAAKKDAGIFDQERDEIFEELKRRGTK